MIEPGTRPLRVVFLGTPAYAVPSLEGIVASGAELRAVVCQPDKPVGRGLQLQAPPVKVWAQERGIPVLQPEKVRNGRLRDALAPFEPDVLVVTAYGRILPPEVLALPPLGALNGHASILPKYRGAAPIQWAIARGETETGVTVMQMDAGLDTGDILLVRTTPIGPHETAPELFDRLSVLTGEALADALRHLQSRGPLPRIPQDSSQATLAPLLTRDDGRLDLSHPAGELSNRVRGFTPWPGTTLQVADKTLKVHRVRVAGVTTDATPGTVLFVTADALSVACGGGTVLELLEVQPENKPRMSAPAFAAGYRIKPGDRLG